MLAQFELACCVAVGDVIYVGTDDARVLRVSPDGKDGATPRFRRGRWARQMVRGHSTHQRSTRRASARDPFDNRDSERRRCSLPTCTSADIPRSEDGGVTWQPTIDIDCDVHEVRAHPEPFGHPGGCRSSWTLHQPRRSATWEVEQEGLHASYCSAVAFRDETSSWPQRRTTLQRRAGSTDDRVDGDGPLVAARSGLPLWIGGIADTGCISELGSSDRRQGRQPLRFRRHCTSWSRLAHGLSTPSSVLIV